MDQIDRTSATPYYLQLAQILQREIGGGRFGPNDRLPSESELCRTFDLSRSTVRETLRSLQEQRVIRMVPRRGAFVAAREDRGWLLQVTGGFFEYEADKSGREVETVVLRSGFTRLDHESALELELEEGTEGFMLERVRSVDGERVLHSINYHPAIVGRALLGKPVLEGKHSLNATLHDAGFKIFSARRQVQAVPAPGEIARHLDLRPGEPVLLIRSVSRDEHGRPFDYYRSHVRSDRVTVAIEASTINEAQDLGGSA